MEEEIQVIAKRCPKCNKITLMYDAKKGRIYCTSCGFEEYVKVVR